VGQKSKLDYFCNNFCLPQGSAVTQTVLGGLTINTAVANFLQCICAKNYENWLAVD